MTLLKMTAVAVSLAFRRPRCAPRLSCQATDTGFGSAVSQSCLAAEFSLHFGFRTYRYARWPNNCNVRHGPYIKQRRFSS